MAGDAAAITFVMDKKKTSTSIFGLFWQLSSSSSLITVKLEILAEINFH